MTMTAKRPSGSARRPSRRIGAILASCALAALLAGCGSSASTTGSAASASGSAGSAGSASSADAGTGPVTPGSGKQSPSSTPAVASVSGTPITKSAYEHWREVDAADGAKGNIGHRALAFLITSSWVLGEAAHRHATVTESEVSKRLAALEHKSFPKKGELQAFLNKSKQTQQDLQMRVKVEMLSGLIKGEIRATASKGKANAALASFEGEFKARWRARTSCQPAYVMEDCKQYKGSGEPALSEPAAGSSSAKAGSSASSSGSSAGAGSSSSKASAQSGSSSTGEVYSAPGAFAVQSPAFTRNGPIPAKYTCDGAGTSPPLQLSNVPKKASELVLFVIDDTNSTPTGGIRWVLGGINPSTSSIAAGQTPAGAIVGTNGEGKAAYGPICPAKGKTDTIEIVAYALKKPIKLSPGFQPSLAESEYGSTKDLLGEAAVTYATYHRP